jgi:spore cortex formation protein SpoVR/YcgB (stage V sporulation)
LNHFLKKNYHIQYTDVRDTIFKYIIKIYTKDKISEYLQYFDDISVEKLLE